jgi:hypothetical protein
MTASKLQRASPLDAGMAERLNSGADELISAVAEFLIRSDIPRESIARVLQDVAARVNSGGRVSEWEGGIADFTNRLGQAYQTWWADPEFLDERGNPIPLKASGPGLSVKGLLGEHLSPDEIDLGIKVLRDSMCLTVSDDGYWRPHEPTLVIKPDRELSFQRLVGLVRGLLSTFSANNAKSRSGEGLLERAVVSADLPANFVPVLNRAAHEHFGQALFAMLQMIKNAEQRTGRRSGTEVGIEVFTTSPRFQ